MFFLYYSGIPVLLTIMGKANWFYSQKIGGKMTVFDWLREVWFDSNYPEFPPKNERFKKSGFFCICFKLFKCLSGMPETI